MTGRADVRPPDEVVAAVESKRSVLPVDEHKQPFGSWKQLQQRRASVPELCKAMGAHDVAAWAIVTGEISGLVAFDFDGEAGHRTLERLGVSPHVRTGSGGFHVYVEHPGHPVPTVNGKSKRSLAANLPGVDIRGDGGYAVFCGRSRAGVYKQLRPLIPDPVETLPDELRALLKRVPSKPTVNPSLRKRVESGGVEGRLAEALRRAPEEGRNTAGFWLARMLRDDGVDEDAAETIVLSFAAQVGDLNMKGEPEPYTPQEALASVRQAYSRPPSTQGSQPEQLPVSVRLIELVTDADAELFHDGRNKAYARVVVGDHREVHAVDSTSFQRWLQRQHYEDQGKPAGATAFNAAVKLLEARAMFDGPLRDALLRVAALDDAVYLDLCDDRWRAVRVTAEGWQVVTDPPVCFRRPAGMAPLPEPVRGGSLDGLLEFINISDADWPLLAGALVGMLRPTGPYPVLVLTGRQGCAKSTTGRIIRSLIDPSAAPCAPTRGTSVISRSPRKTAGSSPGTTCPASRCASRTRCAASPPAVATPPVSCTRTPKRRSSTRSAPSF